MELHYNTQNAHSILNSFLNVTGRATLENKMTLPGARCQKPL